jgi:hypothetical protein
MSYLVQYFNDAGNYSVQVRLDIGYSASARQGWGWLGFTISWAAHHGMEY